MNVTVRVNIWNGVDSWIGIDPVAGVDIGLVTSSSLQSENLRPECPHIILHVVNRVFHRIEQSFDMAGVAMDVSTPTSGSELCMIKKVFDLMEAPVNDPQVLFQVMEGP